MTSRKAKIEQVHIEEAAQLRQLFDNRPAPRLTQAAFGEQFEIGSQAVVWQYLNARIPLNLEKAVRFARGLRCTVADFSPRLADELRSMSATESSQLTTEGASQRYTHSLQSNLQLLMEARGETTASLAAKTHQSKDDIEQVLTGDLAGLSWSEVEKIIKELDVQGFKVGMTATARLPADQSSSTGAAENLTTAIELLLKGGGLSLDDLGGKTLVHDQIAAALLRKSEAQAKAINSANQASARNLSWSDADLDVQITPIIPTAESKQVMKKKTGTTPAKG